MRIPSILFVTALLAGPAAAAEPVRGDGCAATATKTAGAVAKFGRLGDEPPAARVAALYRRDGRGCPAPIVLRKGIGANPDKALPVAGEGRLERVK